MLCGLCVTNFIAKDANLKFACMYDCTLARIEANFRVSAQSLAKANEQEGSEGTVYPLLEPTKA